MCVPRVKKTADGGLYPVEPSIFVREIPRELVEEQKLYSAPAPKPFDDDDDDDLGGGYGGRGSGYGGRSGGFGGRGKSQPSYTTSWRR